MIDCVTRFPHPRTAAADVDVLLLCRKEVKARAVLYWRIRLQNFRA
jgi:hypothetical protein